MFLKFIFVKYIKLSAENYLETEVNQSEEARYQSKPGMQGKNFVMHAQKK